MLKLLESTKDWCLWKRGWFKIFRTTSPSLTLKEKHSFYQGVAKVKADGWVGDITLGAVNGQQWRPIYLGLLARRYQGFAAFVKSKPRQLKWLKGWVNRANEFLLRL